MPNPPSCTQPNHNVCFFTRSTTSGPPNKLALSFTLPNITIAVTPSVVLHDTSDSNGPLLHVYHTYQSTLVPA